jgi:hypothetical protein
MKHIAFYLLFVFAVSPPVLADDPAAGLSRDYLAADEASAKFRTHEIDPAIARIPERLSRNVLSDYSTYLPQLAAFFKKDAENDFQVIKRMHDWIDDNIAYQFYAKTDIKSVLADRRTNCVGYSALLKLLAGYAGIKADVVLGYSRSYLHPNGAAGTHAWNVVSLSGKRYLVDTTHDARERYRDGVRSQKKPYTDDELFLNPAYKILIDYPYERSYQLLDHAIGYAEFLSPPRVRLSFIRFGLAFADPAFAKTIVTARLPIPGTNLTGLSDGIKAVTPQRLALANQSNLDVRLILADVKAGPNGDDPNPDYERFARTETKDGQAVLTFSAPGKGDYRASVQVRLPGGQTWETVYSFVVMGE